MRLSLFRAKSNSHSPGNNTINSNSNSNITGNGNANANGNSGASTPISQKRTNRLSSMFSQSRAKSETSEDQQTLSSPVPAIPQRPSTASAPSNPPPTASNDTPPPTRPLDSQISSDGPPLPTSPPDQSFLSSSTVASAGPMNGLDGTNDAKDGPYPSTLNRPFMALSRPKTTSSSEPSREIHSSSLQSQQWDSCNQGLRQSKPSSEEGRSNVSVIPERYNRPSQRSSRHSPSPASTPTERFQTPATRFRTSQKPQYSYPEEDQISYGENSFIGSSLQHRLSSPSAAAAQRSKMRAPTAYTRSNGGTSPSLVSPHGEGPTVAKRVGSDSSEPSRVSSKHLAPEPGDGGNSSGSERMKKSILGATTSRRPAYLQQHQSSQRSSANSFLSRDSDATVAAQDVGTGGLATPGRNLTRLPSLGSIGSSASGNTEVVTPRGHKRTRSSTLQPTTRGNLDRVNDNREDNVASEQTTPRAKTSESQQPSDTVVARHVRDINVPETVAREYKSSLRLETADRSLIAPSSPFAPKGKNALSLKDQNAKIDKLTKENFDLKLKIHFLHQALQDRSDEGVKDTISKNAQLQAELVQVKKENQSLRKRLRQLERGQGQEATSSIAPSHLESEDGSRSLMSAQLEGEMNYLQLRLQDLELENAQLSKDGQYQQMCARLDEEVARRERAEHKVRLMQQELAHLSGNTSPKAHLRIRTSDRELARHAYPRSAVPRDSPDVPDQESLSGGTLVNQLRQENDDLKRHLGAQASMLTSRNRERERLQQEIEDLKLVQRRGDTLAPGSAAGDSILDRSVSRAQNRSASQNSGSYPESQLSDPERDRYENTTAGLRDENALLKMQLQDLERELNSLGEGAEHIRTLQTERDDSMQALREADTDIDHLNSTIEQLDDMVLLREDEIAQLKDSLRRREKETDDIRAEIDAINESFNLLIDDRESSEATIQSLQQDIANANGELEAMENKLRDITSANERLEVQQESSQNEIAFLREEQESEMIRNSELKSALEFAQSASKSDGEGARDFVEMQTAALESREEARQLRKQMNQREAEIRMLQDKLDDATGTLEEAVSSFDGTKASYGEDIARLQQDIEQMEQQMETARQRLNERDQMLSSREALLESSNHESRRLGTLLEKERQGRKHDRNEAERTMARARGTPEAKVLAMERSRDADKQRLADLEQMLKAQVREREELLCQLWNRISYICNSEGLLEQQQPLAASGEDVSVNLAALDARFPPALDAIATHIATFPGKLEAVERSLTTDFTALSAALSQRSVRLETLETSVGSLSMQGDLTGALRQKYDMAKNEIRILRREIKFMKQGSFALPGLPSPLDDMDGQIDAGAISTANPTSQSQSLGQNVGLVEGEGGDAASPVVHHGPLSKEKSKNRYSAAHSPLSAGVTARVFESDQLPPLSPDQRRLQRQISGRGIGILRSTASATNLQTRPNFDGPGERASVPGAPHTNDVMPSSGRTSNYGPNANDIADPLRQGPQRSASALVTTTAKPTDRTWAMRLDEMKKRMRVEREGRLLDRQSARNRLQEAETEKVALKEELEREREKGLMRGGSAVTESTSIASTSGGAEGISR